MTTAAETTPSTTATADGEVRLLIDGELVESTAGVASTTSTLRPRR